MSGSPRPFEATVPESTARTVRSKETGFGISQDALDEIILEKDVNVLARYGGVKGVLQKLRSDVENGLSSDVVRAYACARAWGLPRGSGGGGLLGAGAAR